MFENFEDSIEGTLEIGRVGDVDDKAVVAIFTGNGVAIPEEDVYDFLTVVRARFDVEGIEVGRAEELGVDDERPNGKAVAIVAEFVQRDVFGDRIGVLIIEQCSDAGMAIVITALGLVGADATEFKFGVEGLVGAGTEEDFGLLSEMLLKEKAEADGRTGAKRDQAGGRAGGWIKVVRTGKGRSLGAVRDFSVVVGGVGDYRETDLAQIGKANCFAAFGLGRGERGQEQGSKNCDDGNDDEELDEGEGGLKKRCESSRSVMRDA